MLCLSWVLWKTHTHHLLQLHQGFGSEGIGKQCPHSLKLVYKIFCTWSLLRRFEFMSWLSLCTYMWCTHLFIYYNQKYYIWIMISITMKLTDIVNIKQKEKHIWQECEWELGEMGEKYRFSLYFLWDSHKSTWLELRKKTERTLRKSYLTATSSSLTSQLWLCQTGHPNYGSRVCGGVCVFTLCSCV